MDGLMQEWPLLQSRILTHAARFHGRTPVITYSVEGSVHRTDYATIEERARKLAQALARLGVTTGDRVATLAWNTWRHLELWFGVSGMGAIAHTVNPRLFDDQIVYILNHAEDRILCLDLSFVPLVERLLPRIESVRHFVILTDRAHMPATTLPGALCYEELVAAERGDYAWPTFDEHTASGLCYTSGTTGNPKGVLYSHRSTVLHCFATISTDTLGISARETALPIVPMFHANAWGVPFATTMTGARLVLNGPHHDPETLWTILDQERVSVTAAVPTIWLALLEYLERTGRKLPYLKAVTIGGAAAPRAMIEAFEKDYDVRVHHAWGMTETNPLGSVGTMTAETAALPEARQLDLKCKQGRPVFGIEMRITDDEDRPLPHDGRSSGHLKVRGPWVARAYFRDDSEILDADGFFDTGDIAHIDAHGFMQITDRSKDVIKSGGEWISSIALENAAVAHPDVREAAVIGIPHPKWTERPLLVVVPQEGRTVSREEMRAFLEGKVARWWLPDDVVMVEDIPHTATGKIRKTALRERFRDYRFSDAMAGD